MSTTCFCIIVEAKLRYTGILSTYSSMLEIEEVSFQHFFFFGAQLAEICNGSWRHKRKKGNPSFTITMKILIASSVYNAVCRNLVSMVLEWPIYRRILKITEHLNPDCTPIKSLKKKMSSSVILRFKFFLLVKFWQYPHDTWQLTQTGLHLKLLCCKVNYKSCYVFQNKFKARNPPPLLNYKQLLHIHIYSYVQYIQTIYTNTFKLSFRKAATFLILWRFVPRLTLLAQKKICWQWRRYDICSNQLPFSFLALHSFPREFK